MKILYQIFILIEHTTWMVLKNFNKEVKVDFETQKETK